MEDIMNSFKKMITNTTIHIIPDDEETLVNTERFLTLREHRCRIYELRYSATKKSKAIKCIYLNW